MLTSSKIKKLLGEIYNEENGLIVKSLLSLERVMSELGVFAYKNWIDGELVSGPKSTKYWLFTEWMFDYENMPDPDAAERLVANGFKVQYTKSKFKESTNPLDRNYENENTKKLTSVDRDVWLVAIQAPISMLKQHSNDFDSFEDLPTYDTSAAPVASDDSIPSEGDF